MANRCEIASISTNCHTSPDTFSTFNCVLTENSFGVDAYELALIGKEAYFRIYPVWNDGTEKNMLWKTELLSPCVNGWLQYPDFDTDYSIPFGEKVPFKYSYGILNDYETLP